VSTLKGRANKKTTLEFATLLYAGEMPAPVAIPQDVNSNTALTQTVFWDARPVCVYATFLFANVGGMGKPTSRPQIPIRSSSMHAPNPRRCSSACSTCVESTQRDHYYQHQALAGKTLQGNCGTNISMFYSNFPIVEIGGLLYFPIVKQTISCLHRGNSFQFFLMGPQETIKKSFKIFVVIKICIKKVGARKFICVQIWEDVHLHVRVVRNRGSRGIIPSVKIKLARSGL
jgi:hypothetical protein